jgi:hypothetical protein
MVAADCLVIICPLPAITYALRKMRLFKYKSTPSTREIKAPMAVFFSWMAR